MKKILTLFIALAAVSSVIAQDSTSTIVSVPVKKKDWSKVNLSGRPNDHFMIQIGYNGWASSDTFSTKGIPRSFNFYFMFDLPFKSDPRWSVGIGAGIGSDNKYFENTEIDIAGLSTTKLTFKDVSNAQRFKKYKLGTTYLEAPIELRFAVNPENTNKSWKFAVGGKIGTLLGAYVKGKTLLSASGATINSYTMKEKSKRFFNTTRLSVGGRISYGAVGIYGSYQVNTFLKTDAGPDIRPFQIGLVFSGL